MSFKPLFRDSDNTVSLSIKAKRSQSALEYMMTYGWAILIIVIVAVILYSMGIFNPSSSITFTSSGFSPFTISSVICSQDGLSFSVLAGPMPNGAYSMSINSFYIVSSSGTNTSRISYTLSSPITLTSGKTGVIAVPNVVCPSAGTKVSMSANLEYSYSTTAGKVVTNTTGTLAGTATHGPTLPAGIEYYSQLTVSNSQSTATPSPFQQMVNFTSSDPGWTSISTSNFGQNVEFFYYNGTVIPSWLENYTSSHALWWLKIAAIPAGSSETVYVGFAPTSTNLFNTANDGEAPQLTCPNPSNTASCSTYAEYDDGANVFNIYNNFEGTALTSHISTISGVSIGQNNGLQINITSTDSGTYYIMTNYDLVNPFVYQSLITAQNSEADGNFQEGLVIDSNTLTSQDTGGGPGGDNYIFRVGNAQGNFLEILEGGSDLLYSPLSTSLSYPYTSIETIQQNSTGLYVADDGRTASVSTTALSSGYIGFYEYVQSAIGKQVFIQWMRVRAYPPNGVMPSVSFSSVS